MSKTFLLSVLMTLASVSMAKAQQQKIHCPTEATITATTSEMINFTGAVPKTQLKLTSLSITPKGNSFTLNCQYPAFQLEEILNNFSSCTTNLLGKTSNTTCVGPDCYVICETGNMHVGKL